MPGFAAGSPSCSARGGCGPRAGGQTCHSAAQGPAPAPAPALTSAAAWRAGTPGTAAATAPAVALSWSPGRARRRSPPSAAPTSRRAAWPLPAPVRSPARPGLRRGARTVVPPAVPPAFPAAGAGAAPPGAMGVLVPAGVVRGRARSGRRWAGPGALQRGRQDPLPARHRAVPPPPLRPAVVPQPGKGAPRPGEAGSLRPGKGSNGWFPVCLFLSRPRAASTPSSVSGRCAEWRCTTGTRCLSPSPGLSTRSCWAWSPTSATWRSCSQPQAGTSQAGPRCCWEAMAEAGLLP